MEVFLNGPEPRLKVALGWDTYEQGHTFKITLDRFHTAQVGDLYSFLFIVL